MKDSGIGDDHEFVAVVQEIGIRRAIRESCLEKAKEFPAADERGWTQIDLIGVQAFPSGEKRRPCRTLGQQVTLNPGSRWRKWTRHLAASQRLEAAATLGNHNAGKISSFRFWRLLLATAGLKNNRALMQHHPGSTIPLKEFRKKEGQRTNRGPRSEKGREGRGHEGFGKRADGRIVGGVRFGVWFPYDRSVARSFPAGQPRDR